MITGAHAIIYSSDADADRAFIKDVLQFPHVDVGGGWLIFRLPPSELAFHPAEHGGTHELYLTCEDIEGFIDTMSAKGVECSSIHEEAWGRLIDIILPGGGKLGVYQPHHARPSSS